MEPILELKNINYAYHSLEGETKALTDISFSVCPGEFVSIVGPSGCGNATGMRRQQLFRHMPVIFRHLFSCFFGRQRGAFIVGFRGPAFPAGTPAAADKNMRPLTVPQDPVQYDPQVLPFFRNGKRMIQCPKGRDPVFQKFQLFLSAPHHPACLL